MLEGGSAQLIDSRPLVPEPVVRPPPAAASRDEPGRPLPFMDESQVVPYSLFGNIHIPLRYLNWKNCISVKERFRKLLFVTKI
jgi:hypothetical protein